MGDARIHITVAELTTADGRTSGHATTSVTEGGQRRAPDLTQITPEMIAAAWAAWKPRHKGSVGPGPAFREAIIAALEAAPARVRSGEDGHG